MSMMSGVRKLLSHRAPMNAAATKTADSHVEKSGEAASPPEAEAASVDGVEISELADAVRAAKISRVIFVGTPDANRAAGVLLARTLTATGASTVLVDMTRDGHAAWDMGVIGRAESVRTLAVSPAVFADSIHRDRRSRAHVMSASLAMSHAEDSASEAVKAVLSALTQAYARSVIVFDDIPFHLFGDIVDENTALVLPLGAGEAASAFDSRPKLANFGLAEPVALFLPLAAEQSRAA